MTKMITEAKELYGFLATPGVEVMNLAFASDDVVWISWMYGAEEDLSSQRHSKVVKGAYVTTGARIHLYPYLDRLRENAMYCNTDSVIYIQPNGDGPQLIETWDKLGDMNTKLRPSKTISEFVSGGQKTTRTGCLPGTVEKLLCKVRGITLDYKEMKIVNFKEIRDMILKWKKGDGPTSGERKRVGP